MTWKIWAISASSNTFVIDVILPTGASKLKVLATSVAASSEVRRKTISSAVDAAVAVDLSAIRQVIYVADVV